MVNFLQEQALQWVGVSAVPRVLSPHTTRTSLCSQSSKLVSIILPLPRNFLSGSLSSQGFSCSVPFTVHSSSNHFHFMLHPPPPSNCQAACQQITPHPPNTYFSAWVRSHQASLSHTFPRGYEHGTLFARETSSWHGNQLQGDQGLLTNQTGWPPITPGKWKLFGAVLHLSSNISSETFP